MTSHRRFLRLCFFASLTLVSLIISCKKSDFQTSEVADSSSSAYERTFFSESSSVDPVTQRVVDQFHSQRFSGTFYKDFLSKYGVPCWQKLITIPQKLQAFGRGGGGSRPDTLVVIPVADSAGVEIKTYVETYLHDTSTVIVHTANEYSSCRFSNHDTAVNSAERVGIRFMILNNVVYNYHNFKIKDKRLFNTSGNYLDTANIETNIVVDTASSLVYLSTSCVYITTTTSVRHCTLTGRCTPTSCDNCSLCVDVSIVSSSECSTWFLYEEEGGGTGGAGGAGGPGGSGGGGTTPTCNGSGQLGGLPQLPCGNNLPGGWISIDDIETPAPGSVSEEATPGMLNHDPDVYWWTDNTTTFPTQALPSWADMNSHYPKNSAGGDLPAPSVYALVGGDVLALYNSDPGSFQNACALRVSRALNYSEVVIPNISGQTFKGADNKYYFLSSAKLFNFMKKTFGPPTIKLNNAQGGTNGSGFASHLAGHKGIYIMQVNYPGLFGALGHASLFNGSECVGGVIHNYYDAEGGVYAINLWELN